MMNKSFKITIFIAGLYAFFMLTIIGWGIPNNNHSYNYHMDEWHQMQAVRATFKYGTPNVAGAAHGSIFQFLLTGIYLTPFIILKIVDPFAIKSAVTQLMMQHRLFEILRINTLIFGVLTIVVLAKIAINHLKINPSFSIILFVLTPIWLTLSNFFKYDIALVFWITISLLFFFRYASNPSLINFLLAGVFSSLALATKLSALPILPIYILSFFYYTPAVKKKYSHLIFGLMIFLLGFIIFGIPDFFLRRGDYSEFLYSNLITSPKDSSNFLLNPSPWWIYLFFKILPFDFGYAFWILSIVALIYWTIFKNPSSKNIFFLLICLAIFIISLFPLKFYAGGNRMLVLLPFLALLSGAFIKSVKSRLSGKYRKLFTLLIFIVFAFQFLQSFIMIYTKWKIDIRSSSSDWIEGNIKKGSVVGIENIPIYQSLPDIVVKEFYSKQQNPKYKTLFDYQIVNRGSQSLPNIVIITNRELDESYLKNSPKKALLARLKRENYKKTVEFKPPEILYRIMGNELGFYASGIVAFPSISIFEKKFK